MPSIHKRSDAVAVALSFGIESFCRFCFGTVLALVDTLRGFRARFAGMIVIGRIEDREFSITVQKLSSGCANI